MKRRLYTALFLAFFFGAIFYKSIDRYPLPVGEMYLRLILAFCTVAFASLLSAVATMGSLSKAGLKILLVAIVTGLLHPYLVIRASILVLKTTNGLEVYIMGYGTTVALFTVVVLIILAVETAVLSAVFMRILSPDGLLSIKETVMRTVTFASVFFHPILIWYGLSNAELKLFSQLIISHTLASIAIVYIVVRWKKASVLIMYLAAAVLIDCAVIVALT